jgi:hypothetical protein
MPSAAGGRSRAVALRPRQAPTLERDDLASELLDLDKIESQGRRTADDSSNHGGSGAAALDASSVLSAAARIEAEVTQAVLARVEAHLPPAGSAADDPAETEAEERRLALQNAIDGVDGPNERGRPAGVVTSRSIGDAALMRQAPPARPPSPNYADIVAEEDAD